MSTNDSEWRRAVRPLMGDAASPPMQLPIEMMREMSAKEVDPDQAAETHNMALLYVYDAQQELGLDPIHYDGPPTCFSRDRRVACGVVFNMNSNTAITAIGHTLNAVGTAGVLLTIVFVVMWMNNGTGSRQYDFTALMKLHDDVPNWWIAFPGAVGFACLGAAHILYLIGGSLVPSIFMLLCDATGLGGSMVIWFGSTNALNRLIGLSMTFGSLGLLVLIMFIILSARDPRYADPRQMGGKSGISAAQGQMASAPRLAGALVQPGSGQFSRKAAMIAGEPRAPVTASRVGARGKGRKSQLNL